MSQPSAQPSDSGAADLHLSARSVLLPVERGSASSSSLQRQVSLDCASAEHSPSFRGLGSLTRVPSNPAVNSIESVAAQLAAASSVVAGKRYVQVRRGKKEKYVGCFSNQGGGRAEGRGGAA